MRKILIDTSVIITVLDKGADERLAKTASCPQTNKKNSYYFV